MTCAEFEILLSDYVDGHVTVEQRRQVETHADHCAACRELLRDVFQAVSFLENAAEIVPPPELITRIVYQAPQGKIRGASDQPGFWSKFFSRWLQPVLQPRMAMGMAMTILSFAMLGRCTGLQMQQIRASDLSPGALWNNLEDKLYRSWDRTVKYYENLRLVYEVETRLKELREQQDAEQTNAPAQDGAATGDRHGNGGEKR
jgi:anti-sigma factor RsiW